MPIKVVCINPGSTSTKVAYYEDDNKVFEKTVAFEKKVYRDKVYALDEYQARMDGILALFNDAGVDLKNIDCFMSRGGAPDTVDYGAYNIDKTVVICNCFSGSVTFHASILGPVIAYELARQAGGKPCMFYDAITASRPGKYATAAGIPGMKRRIGGHNLNTRMVGREVAEKMGKKYEDCNFVVAHLGGGMSISAHEHGIIVDSVMASEGPMSPQRAGTMDFTQTFRMCFSGEYTMQDMQRITDNGGLLSFLGAKDMLEVEEMIANGDEKADYWYNAMAYQIAKSIGSMCAVLKGDVDAIILTGGISNSKKFTGILSDYCRKLAPVEIAAGEREMLALARGGIRVLKGEEEAKTYTGALPNGAKDLKEVVEIFKTLRPDTLDLPATKKWMALVEED